MKTGLAIAKRREEIGMTQDELAKIVGVSKASISRWESGDITNMRRDRIQKLANALNVSPLSLLEEETKGLTDSFSQQSNAQLLPSEYIRMIPCFESASAGFGTDAQNRIIELIPIYIVNEQEAAETICITVRGDSMHPRIEDGDIVQVHKQDTAETGDIVVILDGDEAFVKRFIHGKNGVILESFNPAYPPMKFTKEESNRLRIVGVVKRIIRNL
jgi:repressor LexA